MSSDPQTAAEDIVAHLRTVEPLTQHNWGFTGTRNAITAAQWHWLNKIVTTSEAIHEVHHGACVNADEQFHFLAIMAHVPNIYVHPPVNQRFMSKQVFVTPKNGTVIHYLPAKPYHDRNHDIVDQSNRLLALPDGPERLHSGTWSTIRYARHKKIQRIDICYPNGLVKTEEYPQEETDGV